MGIQDHLTCLLRNLYAGQEATIRTRHGTKDWFQIGKEYIKAIYCHPVYLTYMQSSVQFSSVQSLSHVQLFATPWTRARHASLSITNSRSSIRLTSIESMMPSSHLILCRPLLHLPPIPPSIRVFSNGSALCIRWPKYWSFSLNISSFNEHPGLISFRMDQVMKIKVSWVMV